jgi:SOS response regulatory protein OraA/RecX
MIKLTKKNIVTHIDHVQPLYYEGKNEYTNLVLACRRCNLKKWISDKRIVPQWIRDNEQTYNNNQRVGALRWRQREQMKALVEQELQEQLANELGWIT